MSSNDLFSPASKIDPEKDYTAELVGEGKTYADAKALARATVEKEYFIQQLKQELTELREDLRTRKTVEDAVKTLSNANSTSNSENVGNTAESGSGKTPVALDEETFNLRVRETVASTLKAEQSALNEQRNIETVRSSLEQAWGKDFATKLTSVAEEIGASQDYLMGIAKTSPKAFLKLVGADAPAKKDEPVGSLFQPSAAGINSAALAQSNRGKLPEQESYSYWQKVRKENPTFYHSPAAATARFEAAKKHGDAFFQS